MKEEERKLWEKIAEKGQFIAFRFDDTGKPPCGLVFQVGEEKYIVRAGRSGRLEVESYW